MVHLSLKLSAAQSKARVCLRKASELEAELMTSQQRAETLTIAAEEADARAAVMQKEALEKAQAAAAVEDAKKQLERKAAMDGHRAVQHAQAEAKKAAAEKAALRTRIEDLEAAAVAQEETHRTEMAAARMQAEAAVAAACEEAANGEALGLPSAAASQLVATRDAALQLATRLLRVVGVSVIAEEAAGGGGHEVPSTPCAGSGGSFSSEVTPAHGGSSPPDRRKSAAAAFQSAGRRRGSMRDHLTRFARNASPSGGTESEPRRTRRTPIDSSPSQRGVSRTPSPGAPAVSTRLGGGVGSSAPAHARGGSLALDALSFKGLGADEATLGALLEVETARTAFLGRVEEAIRVQTAMVATQLAHAKSAVSVTPGDSEAAQADIEAAPANGKAVDAPGRQVTESAESAADASAEEVRADDEPSRTALVDELTQREAELERREQELERQEQELGVARGALAAVRDERTRELATSEAQVGVLIQALGEADTEHAERTEIMWELVAERDERDEALGEAEIALQEADASNAAKSSQLRAVAHHLSLLLGGTPLTELAEGGAALGKLTEAHELAASVRPTGGLDGGIVGGGELLRILQPHEADGDVSAANTDGTSPALHSPAAGTGYRAAAERSGRFAPATVVSGCGDVPVAPEPLDGPARQAPLSPSAPILSSRPGSANRRKQLPPLKLT